MGIVLLSVLIALALYGAGLGAIWFCAYQEFLWCFVPGNTIAFVTWGKSDSTNVSQLTGGELDKVLHGIPGKKLNTDDSDPFKWYFDVGVEERSLLHRLFGIRWFGWGRSLRKNQVHETRFKKVKMKVKDIEGKEIEKDVYSIEGKDYTTKFIYYSREQAVEVLGSETQGAFKIDSRFNLLYAMKYPVRAVFGMADPNAVLTGMVMQKANGAINVQEAEYFLYGDNKDGKKKDHQDELVKAIQSIEDEAEKQVGLDITAVNLLSVDVDEATRTLLELTERTERENKASLAKAENARRETILAGEAKATAQKAMNDADADRVTRVLKPMAELPNAVGLRLAEALEKNSTLTTLVVGGKTSQLIGGTK